MGLFDRLTQRTGNRMLDRLKGEVLDKVTEVWNERRQAGAPSDWPCASVADGRDVFSRLDAQFALSNFNVGKDTPRRRHEGLDASGWYWGQGLRLGPLDLDYDEGQVARAGRDDDLWVEALHEPVFGTLSFEAFRFTLLDDMRSQRRYDEIPDGLGPNDRRVYTGRIRGSGTEAAIVHLDPLVLRLRHENPAPNRRFDVAVLLDRVLKALDVDAYRSWREDVLALRSERARPTDGPSGAPAGGLEPVAAGNDPATVGAPGGSMTIPSADAVAAALDGPLDDPAAVDVPHDALEAAFSAPIQRVRTIGGDGFEGMRYQAQGGRVLDLVRLTPPGARDAVVEALGADGMADAGEGWSWANLPDDAGAIRQVLVHDETVWVLALRQVKREHVPPIVRAVLDALRG